MFALQVLAQDNKVFKEGLTQLNHLLDQLSPLYQASCMKGSVLLHELASNEQPGQAMHKKSQTPLLHAMSAAHAYINMFVHICRGSQVGVFEYIRPSLSYYNDFFSGSAINISWKNVNV